MIFVIPNSAIYQRTCYLGVIQERSEQFKREFKSTRPHHSKSLARANVRGHGEIQSLREGVGMKRIAEQHPLKEASRITETLRRLGFAR